MTASAAARPLEDARSREWALGEHGRGATLVIDDLGSASLPIARLEARLLAPLGGTTTSAYWSPPGARGLDAHFDNQDVLVLQIAGTKTWSFHGDGLVALPLPTQQRRIDEATLRRCPRTRTLRAGDLLYLPRGVAHSARAGDDASLHLTIAVAPTLWLDVLTEALAIAAERDVDLRRAAPRQRERRVADGTPARVLSSLLESVERGAIELAWSRARHRLFAGARRLPARGDRSRDRIGPLRLRDRVEREPAVPVHVGPIDEGIGMSFPGLAAPARGVAAVRGPEWLEPAMRFVAASSRPFAVDALPGGLADETKLALVGGLLDEGLLRRA